MENPSVRLPDNAWFGGKIASWEARSSGYRALFEVIVDPEHFLETVNSAGDVEIIELFEPGPGDVLKLTYVDDNDYPLANTTVVLDESNPFATIPFGSRYVMDATQSTNEHLAYTCVCFGEPALVG